MKKITEWAFLVGFVIVFAGAGWWLPFYMEQINNKPKLPYSRPHLELSKPDGTKCAAWIVAEAGAYIVLCENEPLQIVPMGEFNSYRRQNMERGV